jgi:spermidine/putrescine transport system permease protein
MIWSLLFFIFVYAPLSVLVIFSFDNSMIFTLPLQGFTFQWYERLFSNALLMSAIYNSFFVAAGVTVMGTFGGILGSFAVVRYRFRGRNVFNYIVLMPLVIPAIIMGVALLVFFHAIGVDLSLMTVVIAQTVIALPVTILVMVARLIGFDVALEEAAMDLGADELTTFRKVSLPLLLPGVMAAAVMAFTTSFGDVVMAYFTIGYQPTLPVYIFSQIRFASLLPVLTAASALTLSFSAPLVVISDLLRRLGERRGL